MSETLSEKKCVLIGCGGFATEDVKEKIQNVQRRLFNLFGHETGGTMGEIDKIFLEEIGDKLLEKKA